MAFLSFPKRLSDDEYIEKLRRSMEFWNRWRYVMLIANIGLIIAFGVVAERGVMFVLNMALPPGNAPANWPLAGFVCGATMGMAMGWFSWHSLQQLIEAIGGFRSERLLLKYYDAFHTGQLATPAADGGDDSAESNDG